MARSRTIRPTFFTSFTLASVPRDARLLFAGLWVEADDEGRFINSPKALAGAVFPHDDDVTPRMVAGWLEKLEKIGAIVLYEINGGRYGWIPGWEKHAKPPHPSPSKLPKPPREFQERFAKDSGDEQEDDMNGSEVPSGNSALGFGSGFGSGFGFNPPTPLRTVAKGSGNRRRRSPAEQRSTVPWFEGCEPNHANT